MIAVIIGLLLGGAVFSGLAVGVTVAVGARQGCPWCKKQMADLLPGKRGD